MITPRIFLGKMNEASVTDNFIIKLHEALYEKNLPYAGFIYQPDSGLSLICLNNAITLPGHDVDYNFDFENYLATVPLDTKDRIWIVGYDDEHGLQLKRLER